VKRGEGKKERKRNNARWVVCQVQEERNSIQRTVLLEVLLEEPGSLHVDTHGGKDDGEVVLVSVVDTLCRSRSLDEAGLSTDLGGNLIGTSQRRRERI
jgi:hypothetical protein